MDRNTTQKLIVFTDLDGTLLHHHTYRFNDADAALQYLRQSGIPLILNTSKTFAEVLNIRKQLENHHPFIAENGSLVAIPDQYFSAEVLKGSGLSFRSGMWVDLLGGNREEIISILHQVRDEYKFKFTGFEDMSKARLSEMTGLNQKDAGLAKNRMSTEPIVWEDTKRAWQTFVELLGLHDLQWVQGGRFISISRPYDKKDGVVRLLNLYAKMLNKTFVTIGLGDSPNDQGMLDIMDIAVVVKSDRSDDIRLKNSAQVIQTSRRGPEGWQEAMDKILKNFKEI